MTDPWTDRLSEYVDGELDGTDQAALEVHLQDCEVCRSTLDELRAVAATAAGLDDREPEGDLWPGIADRIRAAHTGETPVVDLGQRRRARRRFTFTAPQLAAAAAVLLIVGASATVLTVRGPTGNIESQTVAAPATTELVPAALEVGGATYEAAIAELVEALDQHRGALDSSTIMVLERSIAVIDSAIVEAQNALRGEPNDQYLNAHLAHSKRQKLQLLTRALNIATASS